MLYTGPLSARSPGPASGTRVGYRLEGGPGASAPSRRSVVSSSPKQRGLSPANGVIQDGSDAVITLATS